MDAREFGEGRVALKPKGAARATTDQAIATKLASDLIAGFEKRQRTSVLLGIDAPIPLQEAISATLVDKAKSGRAEPWIDQQQKMLERAIEFFGGSRPLDTIVVKEVKAFAQLLTAADNGRGGTMSDGTVRHYLNALSSVFAWAGEEERVPAGYNPVSAWTKKPRGESGETEWLEAPEACLLLEAARLYRPVRADVANPYTHALVACYLLTGCRESEITGLLVEDVSFDRGTIEIRPNRYRKLKTRHSRRTVTIWPQLAVVLREHVFAQSAGPRTTGLLFPSVRTGMMITDLRRSFDAVADLAGLPHVMARTRATRVTYTAARLQTLDRGEPVSVLTVARELGHTSTAMVERVYSRLGDVRHRAGVVEFLPAAVHTSLKAYDPEAAAKFGERLERLTQRAEQQNRA